MQELVVAPILLNPAVLVRLRILGGEVAQYIVFFSIRTNAEETHELYKISARNRYKFTLDVCYQTETPLSLETTLLLVPYSLTSRLFPVLGRYIDKIIVSVPDLFYFESWNSVVFALEFFVAGTYARLQT